MCNSKSVLSETMAKKEISVSTAPEIRSFQATSEFIILYISKRGRLAVHFSLRLNSWPTCFPDFEHCW